MGEGERRKFEEINITQGYSFGQECIPPPEKLLLPKLAHTIIVTHVNACGTTKTYLTE